MALKVKHDIGTAVSVTLVVSHNPETGAEVTEEKVLLPGATVPDNVSRVVVEKHKAGDARLTRLLEVDEDGYPYEEEPDEETEAVQLTNTTPTALTAEQSAGKPYEQWTRAELDNELGKRQASGRTIEVTGTGSNGNVVNADIATALRADDQAQATAGTASAGDAGSGGNPFTS